MSKEKFRASKKMYLEEANQEEEAECNKAYELIIETFKVNDISKGCGFEAMMLLSVALFSTSSRLSFDEFLNMVTWRLKKAQGMWDRCRETAEEDPKD